MRLHIVAAVALVVTLVAACASLKPGALQPGQTEAQVVAALGQPGTRHALADGATRLEYPRSGQTWMVDLDASGKVTKVAQVLDYVYFRQIRTGMTRDDVLRVLGRPSGSSLERGDRETLVWRYGDGNCLWFQVTLTPARYVMSTRDVGDSTCKGNL